MASDDVRALALPLREPADLDPLTGPTAVRSTAA